MVQVVVNPTTIRSRPRWPLYSISFKYRKCRASPMVRKYLINVLIYPSLQHTSCTCTKSREWAVMYICVRAKRYQFYNCFCDLLYKLFWFRANQFLDFLLNDVVSLAQKQHIHLIIYLFIYGEQNKGLRTRATHTNALSGIFIVLAHSKMKSPRVNISLYADTLSWFRPNQYLLSLRWHIILI